MAIGAKIGTAYVEVEGDFGPLQKQIDALGASMSGKFTKFGNEISSSSPALKDLSKNMDSVSVSADRLVSSEQKVEAAHLKSRAATFALSDAESKLKDIRSAGVNNVGVVEKAELNVEKARFNLNKTTSDASKAERDLTALRASSIKTTDNSTASHKRLSGVMGELGKSFDNSRGSTVTFAAALSIIKPAALATSLGFLTQGLSAVTGGAVAVAAALAPLAGIAAAGAVGVTAAAQAFGVFKLATFGVSDALKEELTNHVQVAAATAAQAQAAKAAAQAIQSAEEGVRTAHEGVRSATEAVTNAQQQAVDASKALVRAREDEKTAEGGLATARLAAKKNIQDLAQAAVDAALNEQEAIRSLASARVELATALAGPTPAEVISAHVRVSESIITEQRATLNLADARDHLAQVEAGPSADDLQGAHNRAADAANAEAHAVLDLADAQANLKTLEDSGTATSDQLARARLNVSDAENHVNDARLSNKKATDDLNTAEAGPNQEDIAKARLDVSSAEDAVVTARTDSAAAQEELKKAEAGGDPDAIAAARLHVAEAENGLKKAREDGKTATDDSNAAEKLGVEGSGEVIKAKQDIKDAADKVKTAEQQLSTAQAGVKDAQHGLAQAHHEVDLALQAVKTAQDNAAASADASQSSIDNLHSKLDSLPKPARDFVQALVDLKPKFEDLQNVAASNLFPGLEAGLTGAMGSFNSVKDVVGGTASALGDLAKKAGELIGSPAWSSDIKTIGDGNEKIIRLLGTAALHLATAFKDILVAALPLATWLATMVDNWAANLEKVTALNRENGTLGRFFETTKDVIRIFADIVGNLADAFGDVVTAAAPLGREVLEAIDRASGHFADWTHSAEGHNALAQYFEDIKDPLFEIGGLIHDVVLGFFRIGNSPGLAQLIRLIRTDLLPALEEVTIESTENFGPVFIRALGGIIALFRQLTTTGGPLTTFVGSVGDFASKLAELLQQHPGLQHIVNDFLLLGGAIQAVNFVQKILGIGRLISIIGVARNAFIAMGIAEEGAWLAALGPIALVIAGVALVVAALVLAYTHIQAFHDNVDHAFQGIKDIINVFASGNALGPFQAAFTVAGDLVKNTFDTMKAVLVAFSRVISGFVDLVAGVLTGDWGRAWQGIKDIFGGTFDAMKAILVGEVRQFGILMKGIVDVMVQVIVLAADLFVHAAEGIINAIWSGITSGITVLLNAGKYVVTQIIAGITAVAGTVTQIAKDIVTWMFDAFTSVAGTVIGFGVAIIARIIAGIVSVATTIAQTAKDIITWIGDAIVSVANTVIGFGTSIVTWIIQGITSLITTIKGAAASIILWMAQAIAGLVASIQKWGKDIVGWIIEGITSLIDTIKGAAVSVVGWMADGFAKTVKTVQQFGKDIVGWVIEGITSLIETVHGAAASMIKWLDEGFAKVVPQIQGFGKNIVGWIVEGLVSGASALESFFHKVIDVLNKPLHALSLPEIPNDWKVFANAKGGTLSMLHSTGEQIPMFARGGRIDRPLAIVGEEAPRHPEYIIPTNPAYRDRAVGLYQTLGQELGLGSMKALMDAGVPAFATGGLLSHQQLAALAASEGLQPADVFAAIAQGESGGAVHGPDGPPSGKGLWQIEWNVWGKIMESMGLNNPYDSIQNAKMAKYVLDHDPHHIRAWVAYTNGSYAQFINNAVPLAGAVGAVTGAIDAAAGFISDLVKGLPSLDSLPEWVKDMAKGVEDLAVDKVKDLISSAADALGFGGAVGPDTPGVTQFQGHPVANWIIGILRQAIAQGVNVTVSSGWRSLAEQTALWNQLGQDPKIVAPPGTSNHEGSVYPRGAVDLSSGSWQSMAEWLARNPQVPLHHYTEPRDPFHFSATGHAKGGILFQGALRPIHEILGMSEDAAADVPFVGSFATGGIVPQTGLAYVHAGESINPGESPNGDWGSNFDVHVHVDDPALKGLIRVEIVEAARRSRGQLYAGRRP